MTRTESLLRVVACAYEGYLLRTGERPYLRDMSREDQERYLGAVRVEETEEGGVLVAAGEALPQVLELHQHAPSRDDEWTALSRIPEHVRAFKDVLPADQRQAEHLAIWMTMGVERPIQGGRVSDTAIELAKKKIEHEKTEAYWRKQPPGARWK